MFGDEFGFGTELQLLRLTLRGDFDSVLATAKLPEIFGGVCGQGMAHGQADVVLVVKSARGVGDDRARNNLLDEHDAATPAIRGFAAHVKPEVDLLEISVKGKGNSPHARLEKQKADNAHERFAVPQIQFRAGRQPGFQYGGCDLEIEHRQMAPLGGEEDFLGRVGHKFTKRTSWSNSSSS